MILRDYQEFAVSEVFRYFEEGNTGNPVIAAPTGTGKSAIIVGFVRKAMEMYPGTRIMKLTHVKELIGQNYDKLLSYWPTAPAGIYSAGLGRRETHCPVTFAGIASAVRKPEAFGRVDLLIVDECHLVSPNQDTMYQKFVDALRQVNPHLKVIGLTATAYRLKQGKLTDGKGLFTDICVDMTTPEAFRWFISEGYLVPLVPRPTLTILDTDKVRITGGEYNQKQLQAAVDKEAVTIAAIHETLYYAGNRDHWLIFASGIEHAEHVAGELEAMGIAATYIHSKMLDKERDKRLADYRAGKYVAMVNNGILTTGFDFPAIDLIVMLRPTQSPGLWVQMLGRGTRPVYEDGFDLSTTEGRLAAIAAGPKQDCLVLDFAGNTKRLGPINDPVLPARKGKKKGGVAPVRICDGCGVYVHASLRECPHCRCEFPRDVKFGYQAGTEELITGSTPKIEEFQVDRVVYREHRKEGRPPSIKATYYCGLRAFNEWVCLEHPGFAGKKARDWWRERAGEAPPETIKEAIPMLNTLTTPGSIRVQVNKKYPEVVGYDFVREATE